MSNKLETADKKYYASKQPLKFDGLAEGSSFPPSHFTYKAKTGADARPSDIYYASPEQHRDAPVVPQKAAFAAIVELTPGLIVLEAIITAYGRGATDVTLKGDEAEINKARIAVDMAVGRNTLTREQADKLKFDVVAAAAPVAPEAPKVDPVPVTPAPVVAEAKPVEPAPAPAPEPAPKPEQLREKPEDEPETVEEEEQVEEKEAQDDGD